MLRILSRLWSRLSGRKAGTDSRSTQRFPIEGKWLPEMPSTPPPLTFSKAEGEFVSRPPIATAVGGTHTDETQSDLLTVQNAEMTIPETGKAPIHTRRRPPYSRTVHEPFHQFWGWVETNPKYKDLYSQSQKSVAGTFCLVCGKETAADDYFSLCNASRAHQKCYDDLHAVCSVVTSVEQAEELFNRNPQKATLFRLIHTYWWDYPPDWLVRRDMVIEATDGGCSICGKKEDLDVHHERPKSQGGDHALENLVCLCREHHQAAHVWDIDIDYNSTKSTTALLKGPPKITELIDRFNHAIDTKGQVTFHYIDKNRKHTNRAVSPNGWKRYGRYGLCVTAFCHLRKQPREFNIRRISNMEVES